MQSHRARAKVRQWFKAQQLDETRRARARDGRARAAARGRDGAESRQRRREGRLREGRRALRRGRARRDQHAGRSRRRSRRSRPPAAAAAEVAADEPPRRSPASSRATGSGSGILIVGVDRLMTGLARCCKPAPPDAIVGFVTRGKGVTIHRAACANVARARATQAERLITAEWGSAARGGVPGRHRGRGDATVRGCCATCRRCSRSERINVTAANTLSRRDLARMEFTLEVKSARRAEARAGAGVRGHRRAVGDAALTGAGRARNPARRRPRRGPRRVPRAGGRRSGLQRNELQRHAVVAPALAGRGRAVVENMAVVPTAAGAVVLGAGARTVIEIAAWSAMRREWS